MPAKEAGPKPRAPKRADETAAVVATLAALPEPDRSLGERLHATVIAAAPGLTPKLWYGMPAYADADGKVVCFFQAAAKFNTRFATLGFQDAAALDDGALWPTAFGLTAWTPDVEARVTELVRKAVS